MFKTDKKRLPDLFILLFFLAAIFLLYSNTFQAPFTFDDDQILENQYITKDRITWHNISRIPASSPNRVRILPNISFALNYYLNASDVFGYHIVNTFIHAAVAFIFYLLAKTTLGLAGPAAVIKRRREIALLAVLLWAVHPLQTNAVTYIVQRMTSMAAFFYLLALLCYVKARLAPAKLRKMILFAATAVLGTMALFSKENSGMLPVMIIGYELFFLATPERQGRDRKTLLIISGLVFAVFLVICWFLLGSDPLTRVLGGYGAREFTLGQRLLTESRIIIHYLSLLLLPVPGRLNLAYNIQISTGPFSPPETFLAIISLIGVAGLIPMLYRINRLTAFAVFWFLGNLAIESSILPLELIFEHRMYIPSMFLMLAGTVWVYRLTVGREQVARVPSVCVLLVLSLLTWQRNEVWKDRVTLWTDVITKAPGSLRGYGNLGNAYVTAQKYDKAKEYLYKAVAIGDRDLSGNFARSSQRQFLAMVYDNLALAHRETGNYDQALESALSALKLNPKRPGPLVTLGITYSKLNQDKKALEFFLQASRQGVESVDLYNNWAVSCFKLGMPEKAIALLKHAIALKPDHAESHYNLGIAYSSLGMLVEAQKEMALGIQLREK